MARSTFRALLTIAGLLVASPALAQFPNIFDSIFGNPPQRPPADVPSRPPSQSQPQYIPPPSGGLPPGPPPGARIRTEPLPPPPGATSAPPRPPNTRPQDPQQAAPDAPGQRPAQPVSTGPPNNEVIVEPPPHKIANPTAVFSGLDKITGRIISFDVAISETVRFGALEVTPRACYSRPPTEAPATDGFIEVDELTLQGELKRIFSGWMFAASPGLNAVEHPIYDVWLTDCKGAPQPTVAEAPVAVAPAPASAQRPAAQRPPAPRTPGQPAPQQRATQQLPLPPAPPAR
jgi:hypothetical protein